MFKKRWIIALFLLWILAAGQLVQGQTKEEERVAQVFAQVGSGEQTGVVEYYGVYKEDFLELKDREVFLGKIAEELGISEGIVVTRTYEEGREETRLEKEGANGSVQLRMITTEADGEYNQHMICNLSLKADMETVLYYRRKLEEFLKPYGKDSRSSANIISSYPGKLSLEKRNQIADGLLEDMDARVVSEHREMELYTIYAYTPLLSEIQMQDGEAVNVNIAMYYSEEQGCTFVYGAVPLVGLDY